MSSRLARRRASPVGFSGPTRAVVLGALVVATACSRSSDRQSAAPSPVRVAAAADLALAFEELGRAFERETSQKLTFSFGSTGLLAKQIREGAPFDVFAAANEAFVEAVVAAGACDGATKRRYARGRIAVWTRGELAVPPRKLSDLADARFGRIAIAHPEHAPYGQAAKQALQSAGLWGTLEPRLVFGENVRQALQFAESGNVEAAIVALGLVVEDKQSSWFLLEESLHRPIDQALVVCSRGDNREGGQAFARFVAREAGRTVLRRYGFLLPGERLTERP